MKYTSILLLMILFLHCSPTVSKIELTPEMPILTSDDYFDPPYKAGWQHLQDGNAQLAMESFQKSTIEDDKLFIGYGFVFILKKQFKLAMDNFDKSLKINQDNLFAKIGKGIVFELTDNSRSAFDIYSSILLSHPEHPMVKKKYLSLKKKKTDEYLKLADSTDPQKDEAGFIQSLQLASYYSPEMMDIKMRIIDYYEKSQQYDKAVKHYELLQKETPKNIELLVSLAKLYETMDKIEDAILVYKNLLELKPDEISYSNKINDLKVKFFDKNLPLKFKDIFFKMELNKEDLAALIGFYFEKYLTTEGVKPKIITDIGTSYARKEIIKVCTLEIMSVRPDHRFSKRTIIKRAQFARIVTNLIDYLNRSDIHPNLTPKPESDRQEPVDIHKIHKNYNMVMRLLNANIMKLDEAGRFNQSMTINPSDAISALKIILNSISFQAQNG